MAVVVAVVVVVVVAVVAVVVVVVVAAVVVVVVAAVVASIICIAHPPCNSGCTELAPCLSSVTLALWTGRYDESDAMYGVTVRAALD